MTAFAVTKATRTGVRPIIALFGESGAGKTYSALMLARGMVGESKVVLVDSESGRGSLYADVIPSGYDVVNLDAPFSPARYIEAMGAAFQSGAAVVVIDSFSHEHEGPGGVLDMAAENESRTGKPGLNNWRQPKFEHAKMVQFMLRAPVPVICCLRAKFKNRQTKDERGKTQIVKDEMLSPIAAEDFLFESTVNGYISGDDHAFHPLKISHPSLNVCFPNGQPISIKHGELLARWCAAPGKAAATAPADPLGALKLKLWRVLGPVRGNAKWGAPEAEAWLRSKKILPENVTIAQLTADDFQIVIDKTEIEMEQAK